MNRASAAIVQGFLKLGPSVLPFADAATPELPMPRLLRLSLFQVTVGMAAVLLIGTLNRVMIVELCCAVVDRRRDAVAAAAVRAAAGSDRLPFGSSSLGSRLAAGAVHLVRHDGAVWRLRDHAVRAAHSLRRHDRPARGSGRSRRRLLFCSSARVCTRFRPLASLWRPILRRSARARGSSRSFARCCSLGWRSAQSPSACCSPISAKCASSRSSRAPRS